MARLKNKLFYAILFAIIFSVIFSVIARLPRYTRLDASTSMDAATPLIPIFVIFYLLSYIFPLAAFLAANNIKQLKTIFKIFILQLLTFSIFFTLIPVAIQHQPILTNDIFSRILILIRTIIDNEWNAFPSHHVASAFLTFLIVKEEKKQFIIPVFIAAFLIIISTLFTKQHVILDVIAGLLLSSIFYLYYIKLLKSDKAVRKVNK